MIAVHAAGSLREVLSEVAKRWQAQGGAPVVLTFGASGLLRERIETGEISHLFACADTTHPQRLADTGGWQAPLVFARNALCAIVQPAITVDTDSLLALLLNDDIRLGTSTPGADPSGDYVWALFRLADQMCPGAFAALDAKALKLTGGAESIQPPAGRGTYAWIMDDGQADVFLTYRTVARSVQREVPRLKIVQLPAALQIGVAYGLTVRSDAPAAVHRLAEFVRLPEARAVFARLGFGPP